MNNKFTFNIIKKLKTINWFFEYKIWLNMSCIILMLIWFFVALFTTNYKFPIWAWHTITGHHVYDLLFSFTIPFFYLWIRKGLRPVWAFVIIAFLVSVNEWAWWITYYIDHYIFNNVNYYLPSGITSKYLAWQALEHLTIQNYLGMAYIIMIALFFYRFKVYKSALFLWLLLLISIYGFWLYLGFPITVDFSGNTILYLDFNTNMIENLHWIIPSTILIFGYDLFFVQNNKLKGLPPIIFRLYFKGSSFKDYEQNTNKLIELDNFLLAHPHYNNNSCSIHIACSEYDFIPFNSIEDFFKRT